MPNRTRLLPRVLTWTCLTALLAFVAVLAVPASDTAHPPEHVTAAHETIINPVSLPNLAPPIPPTTTTSTSTTTTTVANRQPPAAPPASSSDAHDAIAAHFGDIYDQAVAVADCESSLDPTAVSPDGSNWGLFQINTVHRDDFVQFTNTILDDEHAPADDPRRTWEGGVLDARLNAAYARKLYDGHGGWRRDWSCAWAA